MKTAAWTFDTVIQQYSDFLVVAIHSICYYRSLYDRSYFERARMFNCPVQKCRHPLLTDYIHGVVSSIAEELRKSTVNRINVVILSTQDIALERFVFDVSSIPEISPENLHAPFKDTEYAERQLDPQFRGAITKLALCESKLGPLPDDCTFVVTIELKKDVARPRNLESWIEAEDSAAGLGQLAAGKTMYPLKSVGFGSLRLDSWIEESQAKSKLSSTPLASQSNDLSF